MKQVKIEVPEGFEIDNDKSTFECIVFKKTGRNLSATFEEHHEKRRDKLVYHIAGNSAILNGTTVASSAKTNKNVFTTKEQAEAMLALIQLISLRDEYNDGWIPDYTDGKYKYQIFFHEEKLITDFTVRFPSILSFKTKELKDTFYENFKDLIKEAKMFL